MQLGPWLLAYRTLTRMGGPLIRAYMQRRVRTGKEDPARAGERRGIAGIERPAGLLVWLHAASVGEAVSALPLIEQLVNRAPEHYVLVTTGTVTSARLLVERLPDRAFHQYVPVDRLPWVARFLDHWRPDLALWIESELWPNLITATRARGTPLLMVNGRMSARSYRMWCRLPGIVRPVLSCFDLCLGQSEEDAARFRDLGATRVASVGNLKFAAPPLPADPDALSGLEAALGNRPRWLAASTHPGEETIAVAAHRQLAGRQPDILTLIVPRHPARGPAIAGELARSGLRTALRSRGETPGCETEVYIADTLGELGLFFRVAGIAFVGGSLVAHGGHNLLEAAQLDNAILHGPHMQNFADIAADMRAAGATTEVSDAEELASAVEALLTTPSLRSKRAQAGLAVATARRGVLDAVLAALDPWLARLPAVRRDGRAPAKVHARA